MDEVRHVLATWEERLLALQQADERQEEVQTMSNFIIDGVARGLIQAFVTDLAAALDHE